MVFGSCVFPATSRLITYRPRDGRFTARGTVSNEPAGKSDGASENSDAASEKNVDVH